MRRVELCNGSTSSSSPTRSFVIDNMYEFMSVQLVVFFLDKFGLHIPDCDVCDQSMFSMLDVCFLTGSNHYLSQVILYMY